MVIDLLVIVGVGLLAGLGASSLALSYLDSLWVDGARQDWWEAFHLEIGSAFVVLGAVELLLVARAGDVPDRR